ncbi:MAG TPA: SURF1 family cytochrome oxidase biogenesis protein, partial [Telluria sp.]|nr:SURF1 family cytochrome oxidase biogenesis protein [Telluria sp.]
MSGRVPDGAARPAWVRVAAVVGALCCIAVFLALGTWQVQRLQWKRALIARVDQRVHAAPVPAPSGPVTREGHEYLHVVVDGVYLPNHDTLVQAVTDLGPGYWVMTPLCRADGSVVLINRGFVPVAPVIPAQAGTPGAPHADNTSSTATQPTSGPRVRGDDCVGGATVSVSGLLRLTEPSGAFLRKNDPAANRWYSRD